MRSIRWSAACWTPWTSANSRPACPARPRHADDPVIRSIRAIYAGLAQEVDHHLGRIFRRFEGAGSWDNTLILFTADHGEQLFDHWMLGKAGYFDQSAHIPLIIRDPRADADRGRGRTVEAFTEISRCHADPSRSGGAEHPTQLRRRSLLPFCAGHTPPDWRDEVHWSFDFRDIRTRRLERQFGLPSDWCNLQVVRTERLKYVHFAGLPPVLFDLAEDPHEMINRAADPAASSLRLEGLDRMATWRQRSEERTLTGFLARDGVLYEDQEHAASISEAPATRTS